MTTRKEWRRVGNQSGPCNLFLDRYRIARDDVAPHRYVVIDTDNGERFYQKFRTLLDARLFCERNRDQLPGRKLR